MEPVEGASVLVVDDLPENVLLISKYLEGEGCNIQTARSGQEALNQVENQRPDIVLLDVMMPDLDGIEVCRRIKRMEGSGFLPVVLITAYSAQEIRRQGLEAGAEDFLSKPVEREELLARIRNLLRTKRFYDDLRLAYQQIERDVAAIGAIQRSLLPAEQPDLPGVAISSYYQPSRMAGGDYFDYVKIDDHRLGIAVGDVSGHGPQASVLMTMMKMILHLCPDHWAQPARLMEVANRKLQQFVPPGDFITVFYGVLNILEGSLTFTSAGHPPPILFGPGRPGPESLRTQRGYPLCVAASSDCEEMRVTFRSGDRLLIYTDGLIEAQNPEREMLGLDRLLEMLSASGELSARELTSRIIGQVIEFKQNDQFRDDCTMLILEWTEGAAARPTGRRGSDEA